MAFVRVPDLNTARRSTMALEQLDQKLWISLGCPIQGLEFDGKTLEKINTDGDGRIRVPEIIEAVKWVGSVLKIPMS